MTPSPAPSFTPVFRQDVVPSPTEAQLPSSPSVSSDENCKPPSAVLPVEDGNDISENEIVYELIKIWLRWYAQPHVPPSCRIAGYTIDKVEDDPSVYSSALVPRGNFMRMVTFSVKLYQVPSDWMSFAADLDSENWLHVSHVVAVTETGEGYKLEFGYP